MASSSHELEIVNSTHKEGPESTALLPNLENHADSAPSWRVILRELRGPQRLWVTTLSAMIASLIPLLGGYSFGFPSPALLQLNDPQTPAEYQLKDVALAMFTAITPIGALFGGAAAGWAVDVVGRKFALLLSAIPSVIGWFLLTCAHVWHDPAGFKSLILIGQFFTGSVLGSGMLCAPVYIGEISPPALRGLFIGLPILTFSVGILLVYSVGAIPGFTYEYISLVAVAITAVFVVLAAPPWFPMTPRYLLMKDKEDKSGQAQKVLEWLRGPNVIFTEEKEAIKRVVESNVKRLTYREFCSQLSKKNSIISLLLMLFIMAFQMFSGIGALLSFAGDILEAAGYDPTKAQLIASFALGLVQVIVTAIFAFLVDIFGRKVLLTVSGLTTSVSSFGLGAYFYLTRDCSSVNTTSSALSMVSSPLFSSSNPSLCDELKPLIITAIVVYNAGFAFGWGGIPFILITELFPLQTRGFLAGVVAMVNWGCAALVMGSYEEFAELVKPYGAWWTFGILNIISSVCVAVFLPETKGKKLEDIEEQLQSRYRVCVWK